MRTLSLSLAVTLISGIAGAQVQTYDYDAAIKAAKAAVAESARSSRPSCPEAKELERAFHLRFSLPNEIMPTDMDFTFAGCSEEGRNDYLPPYTERHYKGKADFGMTIVTNQGEAQSEVLVSQGHEWIARFGVIDNSVLASGKSVSTKGFELHAVIVDPRVKHPEVNACDKAVEKSVLAQFKGPELMMLTDKAAYYESEDCDICASLDRCDLKTHQVTNVKDAHMIECSDLDGARKSEKVRFDSCK